MNDIINNSTADAGLGDPMDLPFKELLASSPGGGAEQFQMEIEVLCKSLAEGEDRWGQPYKEIVVDYVTLGTRKHKTKKTRPYYPDGELIWNEIGKEPGVQYVVTLTRSVNPQKPYYDWTKIVRKDMVRAKPSLLESISEDEESTSAAANDPSFDTNVDVADIATTR